MKDEIEAIKKTGKVRFVGFTTHDGSIADQLQAAAKGGFVDAIMLSYAPWLAKDSALNKALDACYEKQIGLVAMKLFAGQGASEQVLSEGSRAQGTRAQPAPGACSMPPGPTSGSPASARP